MVQSKPEWRVILDLIRDVDPILFRRIGRKIIHYLFKHKPKRIEEMMAFLGVQENQHHEAQRNGENRPTPRVNFGKLEKFINEVIEILAQEVSDQEILRLTRNWLEEDRLLFMTRTAEKRDVALEEIRDAIRRFESMPERYNVLSHEERIAIRVALIRRFFTEDLDFINTIKNYVKVADFGKILSRTIGPSRGNGKLGGKAMGLFRAQKIIEAFQEKNPYLQNVKIPKTWYITSDGLLEFMNYNALEEMPTIKYRNIAEIKGEYTYLCQIFKHSMLPPEIAKELPALLDDFGEVPLIVRSSSLLEDSKQSVFAGKYKSLFVANQGTKEERLEALKDAILEVYASTFGPDPIEYRREKGLLDFNEEMAIMIQEVVGQKVGKYYFPAFAGVAFSFNEFRWSPRIRRNDGIVRLVAGLGTRAVDRMGEDYPMLISPGQPGLRANITPEEIVRYSQKYLDVINLETVRFESIRIETLIEEVGYDFPQLFNIISFWKDGQLYTPTGNFAKLSSGMPVITFSNLLQYSPFINQIKAILDTLMSVMNCPVDVEFAAGSTPNSIYLLQCRPQSFSEEGEQIRYPDNIPNEDKIFTASKYVTSCQVHGIQYIVYVDPFEYDSLPTIDDMIAVGRVIGELNSRLPARKFILMGPGRWGSRGDIKLGVKVAYSDINNTCLLIEIARKKMGYTPDLSFGTHFFQDLVEAKIHYLPLYPDEPGIIFNEAFLKFSPNCLSEFVPNASNLQNTVRVIRVTDVAPSSTVSVVMDGENDRAIGWIVRELHKSPEIYQREFQSPEMRSGL